RDFAQRLASQTSSNLGQCGSLRIGQLQPRWQFRSQDPVLRRQILVAQQKLLVHRTRYIGQKSPPSAVPHPAVILLCCRWGEFFYHTGKVTREPRFTSIIAAQELPNNRTYVPSTFG